MVSELVKAKLIVLKKQNAIYETQLFTQKFESYTTKKKNYSTAENPHSIDVNDKSWPGNRR